MPSGLYRSVSNQDAPILAEQGNLDRASTRPEAAHVVAIEPSCAPFDRPPVGEAHAILAESVNALAFQLPNQAARPATARHVEQLARRPFHRRRVRAPTVEKHASVIDRPLPHAGID